MPTRHMTLKENSPCCGVKLLLWDKEKQYYVCPCGKFKVTSYGKVLGEKKFNFGWRKKSPPVIPE